MKPTKPKLITLKLQDTDRDYDVKMVVDEIQVINDTVRVYVNGWSLREVFTFDNVRALWVS